MNPGRLVVYVVSAVVVLAATQYLKFGFVEGWRAFSDDDLFNRLFWALLCALFWLPIHRSGGGSIMDL